MFTKKILKGCAVLATSSILSLSTVQSAFAAPGTLATAPLFLSTLVEPNVFFTLDDSGSMDYELVVEAVTNGILRENGLPLLKNDDKDTRIGYLHPDYTQLYTAREILPEPKDAGNSDHQFWVFRHHYGNKVYYNPSIQYTPWPGSNADGTPMFEDADPENAVDDPVHPVNDPIDLTADPDEDSYLPVYYTWTDSNDNGLIEDSDTHAKVIISENDDEAMQNFANWWVYYRSRMNTAKAVLGDVVTKTDATRMGLYLFNGDGNTPTPQYTELASMTDQAKKRDFLEAIYGVRAPQKGTPSRKTLNDVGAIFSDSSSGAILSAANGGECQQHFNVFVSDGFWSGDSPGVGNRDGDDDSDFDGGLFADDHDDTLADVAMKYYESDLNTNLADRVPTQSGVDEAAHQHLVNFMIAFGVKGEVLDESYDPSAEGFEWTKPVAKKSSTVDDMIHAAYNSRGDYLNAGDPVKFEQALNAAIANIAERTATAAAVSINSAKLTTESVVYLAQFNTNRWQGNLFAFKIIDLETGELAVTPDWSAADILTARKIDNSQNPRTMISYDRGKGVPFQWNDLGNKQKFDLRTDPDGDREGNDEGQARLEYLRGSRSDEGKGNFYRERSSRLGDLVNSGPVYVGTPSLRWPDAAPFPTAIGSRYSDFKASASTRDGVVYVGSNDGFLHGFAEADGEEVIAYVPGNLFSEEIGEGYHYLTDPNYQHRYYNDLTPTISDIYADLGNGDEWGTVLISGQRGGGRGIYALNVTDPLDFSESNAEDIALWEFTDDDFDNLGFTYSRPQVALANNGSWVAIFGNGYNDNGDGEASLFIVDIAAGTDGDWDAGDVIEITTNVGTTADRNGLATPALADLDGNGTVDRIYAGDLRGNMWAFDLSSKTTSNWDLDFGGSPLFTTINNQPITVKPSLAKHPNVQDNGSNEPNVMVFFGSGQYLTDADKTTTTLQYFYGVWDDGNGGYTDADLVEQTYDNSFDPKRVLTKNTVNYGSGEYGWFFELPDTGERSVTNSVVRGDLVFFNSFAPNDDPCSVGGYGYRFAVDLLTGGSPDDASFDINNDGIVDENDKATNGVSTATVAAIQQEGFLPEPVFIEDISYTAETPSKVKALTHIPKGRFAWQELLQ